MIFLNLKAGYFEDVFENALLKKLELFILELDKGFAFVERQKRMIIDGVPLRLSTLPLQSPCPPRTRS